MKSGRTADISGKEFVSGEEKKGGGGVEQEGRRGEGG